jgi:methylmalonyl-CoA mutase N-terminal domain/subunit
MGGIVRAIEDGYPQREIANSAYAHQREIDNGERAIVGVNKYVAEEPDRIPILKIDHAVEATQIDRIRTLRAARDAARAGAALEAVRRACAGDENLVPPMLEAVRSCVTLGEVCDVFRNVWGEHHDPAYL